MKTFKGLNTHGQKYVRGWDRTNYCVTQRHIQFIGCPRCLFDQSNEEVFNLWVKYNEASINWKPKDDEQFYNLGFWNNGVKRNIDTQFRTVKLRDNAIREIKRLLKTLPKG